MLHMKCKKSPKLFLSLNFVCFIKEMWCMNDSLHEGERQMNYLLSLPLPHRVLQKCMKARFISSSWNTSCCLLDAPYSFPPLHSILFSFSLPHHSSTHLLPWALKKTYVRWKRDCYLLDIPYLFSLHPVLHIFPSLSSPVLIDSSPVLIDF